MLYTELGKAAVRAPEDRNYGSRKIANIREGAASVDRCAEIWVVHLY